MHEINEFLGCETPKQWVEHALNNLDLLLVDHAHCEKKAASSALAIIYRYPNHHKLVTRMSKIAREELRHFEQVMKILHKRAIEYHHLAPSRYAGELIKLVRTTEPGKLVDGLIVGAFLEARSCERFNAIADYLDEELKSFYRGLLESEARHFKIYLDFAQEFSPEDISPRVKLFAEKEVELITSSDVQFRFHSGPFSA